VRLTRLGRITATSGTAAARRALLVLLATKCRSVPLHAPPTVGVFSKLSILKAFSSPWISKQKADAVEKYHLKEPGG